MTIFYCLIRQAIYQKPSLCLQAFDKACQALSVKLEPLISEQVNLVNFQPRPVDLFYNLSDGQLSYTIEKYILSRHHLVSFYNNLAYLNVRGNISTTFGLRQAGLPVVPMRVVNNNQPERLQAMADGLGGFPLVVKIPGGSRGVGVIKIDSLESLMSVVDWWLNHKIVVTLHPYIPHQRNLRLVVVGDRVVAAKANIKTGLEFRLNISNRHREEAVTCPAFLEELAVRAVRTLGIETGGVDVIEAQDGSYYISEVNFPHNFYPTQQVTGIDIAKEMVNYLVSKSKDFNNV